MTAIAAVGTGSRSDSRGDDGADAETELGGGESEPVEDAQDADANRFEWTSTASSSDSMLVPIYSCIFDFEEAAWSEPLLESEEDGEGEGEGVNWCELEAGVFW